jgi:hypothetical protein
MVDRSAPVSPSLTLAEAMRAALDDMAVAAGAELARMGAAISAALEWGGARGERGDPTGDPPL